MCLNKDKLIYLYNNMDYDAVSMKTAVVLIVEVFCSAPLDRVLWMNELISLTDEDNIPCCQLLVW